MTPAVYVAGMFSMKEYCKKQAAILSSHGFVVTSRWIYETVPHNVTMKNLPDEYHKETAAADIEDIKHAEYFVQFVPTDTELVDTPVRFAARGGRHWEMGYAYALGKKIIVIGPKENIFHYLPGVIHLPTLVDFLLKFTTNASR